MLSLLHLPSISKFQTTWLDVTEALLFPQLCNGPWCECTLADPRPCQWMSVSGCTRGTGAHGAFCGRTCECPPLLDDTKLFEVRLCPFYSHLYSTFSVMLGINGLYLCCSGSCKMGSVFFTGRDGARLRFMGKEEAVWGPRCSCQHVRHAFGWI